LKRPASAGVASDLPCKGCGYNLRGVDQGVNCPECGLPVRDTLEGVAVEESRRDAAAESLRSYSKAFLFGAPLGLFMVSCVGPPLAVLALVGSVQRLIALRNAAKSLPSKVVSAGAQDFKRAQTLLFVELGSGVIALIFLNFGLASAVGPTIDGVIRLAVGGLWFGAMALGLITGSILIDGVIGRLALEVARPKYLMPMIFTAVGVVMFAEIVSAANAPIAVVILLRLIGAAAWGAASGLLAYQGSSAGDELAAPPLKRTLSAPSDSPSAVAEVERDPRRAAAQRAAQQAAQRAAQRATDDDSPIPLD